MKNNAREFIAFAIVALFAFAFFVNPHEPLLIGAMIAAFTTAIGFYLGGSKTGADNAKTNSDTLAAQSASATADPQPVTVVNSSAQPVPTDPVQQGEVK